MGERPTIAAAVLDTVQFRGFIQATKGLCIIVCISIDLLKLLTKTLTDHTTLNKIVQEISLSNSVLCQTCRSTEESSSRLTSSGVEDAQ